MSEPLQDESYLSQPPVYSSALGKYHFNFSSVLMCLIIFGILKQISLLQYFTVTSFLFVKFLSFPFHCKLLVSLLLHRTDIRWFVRMMCNCGITETDTAAGNRGFNHWVTAPR